MLKQVSTVLMLLNGRNCRILIDLKSINQYSFVGYKFTKHAIKQDDMPHLLFADVT